MAGLSKILAGLTPQMADLTQQLVEACAKKGVDLLVYCGRRTVEEQARIWRQSRQADKINGKQANLSQLGYRWLAKVLSEVGPQHGPHVTNAGPGESWHQYGEAIDAVPMIGGKPLWQPEARKAWGSGPWQVYGEAARALGLTWAGDWKGFPEYPHCQFRPEPNPLKVLTPAEVERALNMFTPKVNA